MTDTRTFAIYNSIWRNGVPALLSAAMSAGIAYLSIAENQPFDWRMWLGAVGLGAGAILFGWRTFDRRPILTVDDQGINVTKRWVGFIKWDDIEAAKLDTRLQSRDCYSLYIWPRDQDAWWQRLPWKYQLSWKWFPKWRCIKVLMMNVTPSPEAIQPFLDRFLGARSSHSVESPAS